MIFSRMGRVSYAMSGNMKVYITLRDAGGSILWTQWSLNISLPSGLSTINTLGLIFIPDEGPAQCTHSGVVSQNELFGRLCSMDKELGIYVLYVILPWFQKWFSRLRVCVKFGMLILGRTCTYRFWEKINAVNKDQPACQFLTRGCLTQASLTVLECSVQCLLVRDCLHAWYYGENHCPCTNGYWKGGEARKILF